MWGFSFVSGALMATLSHSRRIDVLSQGVCDSEDFAAIRTRMVSFMAGGFTELAARRLGDEARRATAAGANGLDGERLAHRAVLGPVPLIE